MDRKEFINELTDNLVAVVAIGAITVLGLHGVTDFEIIGAIAGLGGYQIYKRKGLKET